MNNNNNNNIGKFKKLDLINDVRFNASRKPTIDLRGMGWGWGGWGVTLNAIIMP